MYRKITGVALALLLVFSLAGCGRGIFGKSQFVIHVGHVLAQGHPYQYSMDYFKELVETRSDGRISVETFHSSQLGNERDMIEGLQLGTIEMALVSTAPLSSFTQDFYVLDLPFVFDDVESARKTVDSPVGDRLLEELGSQGIVGLCYFENGFRNVTNSKHPIEKPEDLKGFKIRTMENPIHMDSFRALGANPTPMAFGELFTALQQKTIDAQENPLAVIDTSNFYEVQEYLSITEHFYASAPLLIGADFYNRLSEEDQKLILDCAIEARDYQRNLLDELNIILLEELKESGMKINEIDKKIFRDAVEPVYEKYIGYGENQISPELLAQVEGEKS